MSSDNLRLHGAPPHETILVHGGPGAPGYLAPLARTLSADHGLIEAFQTRSSIETLLEELHGIVHSHARRPVNIIGHSFGAWLAIMYASRCQSDVKKLILVSSAPFREEDARDIMHTRFARLTKNRADHLRDLLHQIEIVPGDQQNEMFLEIAAIIRQADAYELCETTLPDANYQYRLYKKVWAEAAALRANGRLLREIELVGATPVVAIHGDHDPHPAERIRSVLKEKLRNFDFHLLEHCGHEPWSENQAREAFLQILRSEL